MSAGRARRNRPVSVARHVACVCGRVCAGRAGLATHGRTCAVERARSEAVVRAVELGLGFDEGQRLAAIAVRETKAGRPAPALPERRPADTGRLSTCAVCGATIKRCEGTGWWHMTGTDHGHRATPDDAAVAGPGIGDNGCEWCTGAPDECDDECDCPTCEGERLLDDAADMWADACRDD